MIEKFSFLEGYGIKLNRLTHDKIEMVRQWRNHPKIKQYMEFQDYITPEMQERWFVSINNDSNYYYIITADNEEIGLINVRDIDFSESKGEPGIFIWNDRFLNSTYGFKAALCLHDFCFEKLGLSHLIIHVLKTNKRAQDYNKALGYVMSENQQNIKNQEYTLTKQNYIKHKERLIKYLL